MLTKTSRSGPEVADPVSIGISRALARTLWLKQVFVALQVPCWDCCQLISGNLDDLTNSVIEILEGRARLLEWWGMYK